MRLPFKTDFEKNVDKLSKKWKKKTKHSLGRFNKVRKEDDISTDNCTFYISINIVTRINLRDKMSGHICQHVA